MALEAAGLGLPVDAVSLPGYCTILGSFVQNRAVSADAISSAWTTLEHFDKQCRYTGELELLPGVGRTKLKIEENRILLYDWSRCTAAAGLQFLMASTNKFPVCPCSVCNSGLHVSCVQSQLRLFTNDRLYILIMGSPRLPRGSIHTTIRELGPKYRTMEGIMGATSLTVVHVDPLGCL